MFKRKKKIVRTDTQYTNVYNELLKLYGLICNENDCVYMYAMKKKKYDTLSYRDACIELLKDIKWELKFYDTALHGKGHVIHIGDMKTDMTYYNTRYDNAFNEFLEVESGEKLVLK